MSKQVYTNPRAGQPLISTISTGCHTPILEVKFCNLVKPFRYPNSPTVPRYSVTCVFDPKHHSEFINGIYAIEKDEKVDSILKNETEKLEGEHLTTGNILIKFQTKDIIPIYIGGKFANGDVPKIELEDELAKGEKIMVIYDILRYTKKNSSTMEHGLSFKPTVIYYYPKEV